MKNIIASLLIIILVASCEKDIRVDVPRQPLKLVLDGLASENTAFKVFVGKTAGILDLTTPNTYKVTNALLQLYENNVLKDTLVYDPNTNMYQVKYNTTAQPGKTYLLKADAPGFTTTEAETVTPEKITIQSITRRVNARTDASGNKLDEVKITFLDNAANSNFYLFRVSRPSYYDGREVVYGPIYCMHSNDKDIDRRNNADPTDLENCMDPQFLMADKNFNGRVKEVILLIDQQDLRTVFNPRNNRTYKPVIEMDGITADYYKYRQSYDAYEDADGNPFAEPVLLFTNVKNGYGFFSTYTVAKDTIR
ncbi:MAG: hypothetical protein JWQ96_1780 [Segetibacter sp.]|nr:hypothetical protein [Segetibacter sp.]